MTWKGYVSFTYDFGDSSAYDQIISFRRRKPIEPFTLAVKEPQWNEAEEAEAWLLDPYDPNFPSTSVSGIIHRFGSLEEAWKALRQTIKKEIWAFNYEIRFEFPNGVQTPSLFNLLKRLDEIAEKIDITKPQTDPLNEYYDKQLQKLLGKIAQQLGFDGLDTNKIHNVNLWPPFQDFNL